MNSVEYARLSREDLDVLLAPENESLNEAWSQLADGLHSMMSLVAASHPRPFISEEDARRIAAEGAAMLRGTRFDAKARANTDVAERLLVAARGANQHAAASFVDRFIDAMMDDDAAIQCYPDPPPPWNSTRGLSPAERYLVGR